MHQLEHSPLLTKAITSSCVAGSGDVSCQFILHKHQQDGADSSPFVLDRARAGRFATLGLFIIGPVSHYWYAKVMKLVPGSGVAVTVKRVLLDQVGFAPLFIPTMFMSSKALEGHSPSSAFRDLKASFAEIYKNNLFLWPAAMAINFSLVPPQFQVLFSNAVGLFWNSYLSFMANDVASVGDGGSEKEGAGLKRKVSRKVPETEAKK